MGTNIDQRDIGFSLSPRPAFTFLYAAPGPLWRSVDLKRSDRKEEKVTRAIEAVVFVGFFVLWTALLVSAVVCNG